MIYSVMKHIKTFESEEELYSDLVNMGFDNKGYYITHLTYTDGDISGGAVAVIGESWTSTCEAVADFFGVDLFDSPKNSFKDMGSLLDWVENELHDMGSYFSLKYKVWELVPKGKRTESFIESADLLSPLKCVEIGQENFIDFYKTKGDPDFES
jgi:hypothetical protein